ncbi:MAG TPA: hypothetical protein DIW44_03895 [Anaerolineaceae bacterium]|nr:hypothetical protein [Anaerolineaceae bacterium]
MELFTIGFTQKTAQTFFEQLASNNVECLVDIRLHPDGQLAGFSKKNDLQYFLRELIDCDYRHIELLAPSDEILKDYRSDKNWQKYEQVYLELMGQRGVPDALDRNLFESKKCCLLCSELTAEHCHRRLAAELIHEKWSGFSIIHL